MGHANLSGYPVRVAEREYEEEEMTDKSDKTYEHELTIEDLDKIAGG